MKYSQFLLITVFTALSLMGCGKKASDPENTIITPSTPKQNEGLKATTRELREAVEAGDVSKTFDLIISERDLDLNYIYENGETLLTIAVKKNLSAIIDILIERNVSIEKTNLWGDTALMVAARNGHEGMVMRFMLMMQNKPELLNAKNQEGDTALLIAIKNNQENIALFLINQGASTDILDRQNLNALKISEGHDVPKVTQLLRSKNQAESGMPTRSSFLDMLQMGDAESLKQLIERNPDILVDYGDENLLVLVLQSQNTETAAEMTQYLLNKYVHPDGPVTATTTPLIEAIKLNRLYFARLYLNKNANYNKRDADEKSPLVWAIEKNNQGAVRLLLSFSAITSYSLIKNGQRITFKACDVARATKKTLKIPSEKKNMEEIISLLNCPRFDFL